MLCMQVLPCMECDRSLFCVLACVLHPSALVNMLSKWCGIYDSASSASSALQVLEGSVGCVDWGCSGAALGILIGQVSSCVAAR